MHHEWLLNDRRQIVSTAMSVISVHLPDLWRTLVYISLMLADYSRIPIVTTFWCFFKTTIKNQHLSLIQEETVCPCPIHDGVYAKDIRIYFWNLVLNNCKSKSTSWSTLAIYPLIFSNSSALYWLTGRGLLVFFAKICSERLFTGSSSPSELLSKPLASGLGWLWAWTELLFCTILAWSFTQQLVGWTFWSGWWAAGLLSMLPYQLLSSLQRLVQSLHHFFFIL